MMLLFKQGQPISLLLLVCLTNFNLNLTHGKEIARSHNYHVATSNRIMTRGAKGELINADHTSTSLKIESRGIDGEVRGVYSYLHPGAPETTVAYIADHISGFKTYPLNRVVALPPFPYSLQAKMAPVKARQNLPVVRNYLNPTFAATSWPWRFPVGQAGPAHKLSGTVLVDKIISSLGFGNQRRGTNRDKDKDIEIDNESSAVVIEPDDDDDDDDEEEEGGGGEIVVGVTDQDGPELDFDSVSSPDAQAAAQGNGTAVAGIVSVAIAAQQQGTAASKPTSQAIAGEGGTAVSAPTSTSIAGVGGIAISGGQSIAISGLPMYSSNIQEPEECDDVGNCVISSAVFRAKSLDDTQAKSTPVTYLIPVVINNNFYSPENKNRQ